MAVVQKSTELKHRSKKSGGNFLWDTLKILFKLKVELCREYIAVYSILEPGLTKWKGRLCEELARTLIKLEGRWDKR